MADETKILGHTLEEWAPKSPMEGPPLADWWGSFLPLNGYWPWYKPPAGGSFSITATASGSGSVSPQTQEVQDGGVATIYITPNSGYEILEILDNGVSKPISSPYVITNVKGNHNVTVKFSAPIVGAFTLGVVNLPAGAVGWTCSFRDLATNDYYTPSNPTVTLQHPLLAPTEEAIMDVGVITGELTVMAVGDNPNVFMDIRGTYKKTITITNGASYVFDCATEEIT